MAHQYPPTYTSSQPPQRPYSPYMQSASSPPDSLVVPPANKRPRLYSSTTPSYSYHHDSPYPSTSSTPMQMHMSRSLNQPSPLQHQGFDASRGAPGSMGPPQRPVDKQERSEKEKATDINDLSDVIGASGINLREEENYLAQTYQNQHQGNVNPKSFNTQFSELHLHGSMTSFSGVSQGSVSSHSAFDGAGPISQPPVSQDSVEEDLLKMHKAAARSIAETAQRELNDPFCRGNAIRKKIGRHTYSQGVAFNVGGLYDRINKDQLQGVKGTQATGPGGTGVVKAQAAALLDTNAPLADILTLLSLATKERMRSILEDAYTLSRTRQLSAQGIVPPAFADIATGNGTPTSTTAIPMSCTQTVWDQPDSAISPKTIPAKRLLDSEIPKNDSSRLPTPPTDTPPTPQPTIAFSSDVVLALRKLQSEDRKHEQERLKKRQRRAAAKGPDGGSAPGTPGVKSIQAEMTLPKVSKKERERLAKAGQTDEVLHKAANTTANMAFGKIGKKYSWLNGGSGSGASTPGRLNTNISSTGLGGEGASGTAANVQGRTLVTKDRKWGSWREDGPKGRGIQMRDLIAALEQDGNEKKTLARILIGLKSDN